MWHSQIALRMSLLNSGAFCGSPDALTHESQPGTQWECVMTEGVTPAEPF